METMEPITELTTGLSPEAFQEDHFQQDALDETITTPSPAASAGTTPATSVSNSASRRPPRKSTLTQQQRNQKRQRATQDQLLTLEMEFNKNPTPTASVRERIAQEINMTERSVQIWFQNRRAKIKMLAKKSIETGEDCDMVPESMRHYLAVQAMESGKPLPPHLVTRPGGPMAHYGSGNMLLNADPNGSGKVVIHHFTCRSLSIGSWRRVGQNAMDLVIFYSPDKACITYYINNDSAGYKIEYPFSYVKNIMLESGDSASNTSGAPARFAGLVVELNRPPNFFMDSSGSGGFYQCGDFTEDQQASQIMIHHLGGHPKVLAGQLAKLVSLESFQNRHSPFDMNAMAASAPVSPTLGIARPASQPSAQFAQPHPHMAMFQDARFGMANMHQAQRMGMPHGHKRQRSRSVPVAVDFSMLRQQPMPSFHIQHPSNDFTADPSIFAPLPHHPSHGPIGPNLRIDTSSGYGMDFRQYPMSAATTSPSEYQSPAFFTPGPSTDGMPAANYNTPYSLPFLSPSPMADPAHLMAPSASPLSQMSHTDPVIADQSPPLSSLHRSASADMFAMSDHGALSDDGLMLSEMYSKQNLNLQMPSLGHDDPSMMSLQDFHTPQETMDMMLPFGTVDPNALSAEHNQH
ncbi:putative homeobox domain-containing protein [Phaeomoniella chlamydospora]|uniref:Putative homeobox domain-containing protein n=1 Tax=Phaeomoniella chlamydospora TaxID=158046 RepID=A0A0G2H5F1_PHACM|nr:putative homeobox domain-containing protein [Phaeomoniella chlamydospora]